jgi:hypothetical protein
MRRLLRAGADHGKWEMKTLVTTWTTRLPIQKNVGLIVQIARTLPQRLPQPERDEKQRA